MGDNKTEKKHLCHVWWFLAVSVICTIIAWIVMWSANNRLEATHNTIIAHQHNSINSVDSLLKIYWESHNDTIRKNSDTLTKQLNSQLLKIAQSAVENDNNERIKNLLESELSKIQNEYEVLNLWCALLTIVFLIFSFFSIFKANEMANQSENALNSMRGIAHDVQKKSETIDREIEDIKIKIATVSNSIEKLSNDKESLSDGIKAIKENDLGLVNSKISDIFKKIDGLYADVATLEDRLNAEYEKRTNAFSIVVESKENSIQSMASDIAKDVAAKTVESHISRIDGLETRFKEMQELLKEAGHVRGEMLYPELNEEDAEDRSLTDSEEGIIDSDELDEELPDGK